MPSWSRVPAAASSAIGSTVVVERMDPAGALETTSFKIVGAAEANPRTDKISNVSPIGAALIGRKPG